MKNLVTFRILFIIFISYFFQNCSNPSYDLIIKNGLVHDGTDTPPTPMEIAITGNQIVKISKKIDGNAAREIDATGLIVAPGFIDIHAHLGPLILMPDAQSHVRQGVTTAFGGPDGSCPFPLGDHFETLDSMGVGMNVGFLVGHNTVRNHVMGMVNKAPTEEELSAMKGHIEKAMLEGAFGMSTGLKYLPGAWAKTDEIVALSKVAEKYGGIYTSHIREEGLGLIDAVEETIDIAEGANIPVVLTHHKAIGMPAWGKSKETLAMVDEARSKGFDVSIDQYPYTASHTSLSVLIPPWSMEGGRYKAFAERCKNPVLRDSIKKGIIFNIMNDRGGGDLRRIQFSIFDWKPELQGKTLHDWALLEKLKPTAENGAELVIEAQLHRGANAIYHAINEEDVIRIMQHPQTMIASDGRLNELNKGHPHPRAYGTFPRVLGHFSREKKVLPLHTALYKMTGLPAQRMGLTDRGFLKENNFADLTIFDSEVIIDKGTFEKPHQYPAGINYVIINGKIVLEGTMYYDIRAGEVLKGKGFK